MEVLVVKLFTLLAIYIYIYIAIYIYIYCRNLSNVLKKINTLTIEYTIKIHQGKCTLMKREMNKDGDQGESSEIQRTVRVSLPSAEASLPR